ncbi:endonuclease/exonuclease/phosphatase family protein [Thermasporomyces composti]|jgi:exonuclease III|uniref:Endonuclease/exonuclease/phosphatase family protein n=1 Tax=Thermasporomyces composti TaxID=696763 RepID=A0A3D9V5U3_THECX|nr:endonuclease/exonuclease/phosphatase family protein [Thermasporomyces composti]REF37172.1 endonuclease/exonuclease/phosphatase family protein [Thermasporomyces composti]
MTRLTTVMMTYNIWGDTFWPQREPALRALLTLRDPDILGVQELRPHSRQVIDEALPGHDRVHDDFPGWSVEGNIWWRRELYELVEYGAEDVGMRETYRRLFWVRLRPRCFQSGPSLVFSTAHFTWPGNPQEVEDDRNPRVEQARRTAEALTRIAGDDACVFVGDLNDHARPIAVLRDAGFRDAFAAMGTSSPTTHPVIPLPVKEDGAAPAYLRKTLDYQFHRGPITPRLSEVIDFFHQGLAPSDHKPVITTYTIDGS